ncbi:AAA family ATPase, partial [Candidatus Dojkabacteria bacterium]|nr:AAA family ATPase [Candidatus Dojkabacteria bacterium]
MKITRIKLQNYKKFQDKELEFLDGLNIIKGSNESGKSTLVSSLYTALFTDVTSRSKKEVAQLATWTSDDLFKIELDFSYKDKSLKLTKDFVAKTALLLDLE